MGSLMVDCPQNFVPAVRRMPGGLGGAVFDIWTEVE